MDVEALKARGNEAVARSSWQEAIEAYSQAIAAVESNPSATPNMLHILYSNRSAAFLGSGNAMMALGDANACIRHSPAPSAAIPADGATPAIPAVAPFSKGHVRKVAALMALRQYQDAIQACAAGLKADAPNSALREHMQQAQTALSEQRKAQEHKLEEAKAAERRAAGGPDDLLSGFFADLESTAPAPASAESASGKPGPDGSGPVAGVKRKAAELEDDYDSKEQAAEEEAEAHVMDNTTASRMTTAAAAAQSAALQKADLGTGKAQIERLVRHPFAKFLNLNPYEILQLPHTASEEDVRTRYRKISGIVHPDKNAGDPDATAAFELVQKAVETLQSPEKKKLIVATIDVAIRAAKRNRKDKLQRGFHESMIPKLDEEIHREIRKAFAEQQQRKKTYEVRIKEEAKREVDEEAAAIEAEATERKQFAEWSKGCGNRAESWHSFNNKKPRLGEGGLVLSDAIRFGAKAAEASSASGVVPAAESYKQHWR
jgi:DnaJ family protein C protein 8